MTTRFFECADGRELLLEVPYANTFSISCDELTERVDYKSHVGALEAFHTKLDELDGQGARELTPWLLFESDQSRYHVRLPVTRTLTRVDLNTGERVDEVHNTVRHAINAYNLWMSEQYQIGLRFVVPTWEEYADHPPHPWVEHAEERHYFAHEHDPSLEFGPEFHMHDNGQVAFMIFQINSLRDGFRFHFNEDGTWSHLSCHVKNREQGASFILFPDYRIDQFSLRGASESRVTAFWMVNDDMNLVTEWSLDGYDADLKKIGEWHHELPARDYWARYEYDHDRLIRTLFLRKNGSLQEVIRYMDNEEREVLGYYPDGQTIKMKGLKVKDRWLEKETFSEDGMPDTYTTYYKNGKERSKKSSYELRCAFLEDEHQELDPLSFDALLAEIRSLMEVPRRSLALTLRLWRLIFELSGKDRARFHDEVMGYLIRSKLMQDPNTPPMIERPADYYRDWRCIIDELSDGMQRSDYQSWLLYGVEIAVPLCALLGDVTVWDEEQRLKVVKPHLNWSPSMNGKVLISVDVTEVMAQDIEFDEKVSRAQAIFEHVLAPLLKSYDVQASPGFYVFGRGYKMCSDIVLAPTWFEEAPAMDGLDLIRQHDAFNQDTEGDAPYIRCAVIEPVYRSMGLHRVQLSEQKEHQAIQKLKLAGHTDISRAYLMINHM